MEYFLLAGLWLHGCSSVALNSEVVKYNTPQPDKTLFAVYMVGGNLEDDVNPRNAVPDESETGRLSPAGAGSNDLREIVAGYRALSNHQKRNLNIVVAFGGAQKSGWQGVKYADIDCLLQDSHDRYFGNATCYGYRNAQTNMAQTESIASFLHFIKTHYAASHTKVLNFWGHGFAYQGMGQDSNHQNDQIDLTRFQAAFAQTHFKATVLGFDACLMGSLEVAAKLKDATDYMIASEALEPVHGWNYQDVLRIWSTSQASLIAERARQTVDSYIEHPEHRTPVSREKTMALLNLKHVNAVVQRLDILLKHLNMASFPQFLHAVKNTPKFGLKNQDKPYTFDLWDWVTRIQDTMPESAATAQPVLDALKDLVVYERHDLAQSSAHGISIYALNQYFVDTYGINQTVSQPWLDFIQTFTRLGGAE